MASGDQPNKAALSTRRPASGWLKDPRKERPNEKIGGGFFIFRRGGTTGRIRPSKWPFEYASAAEAIRRAKVLGQRFPGEKFSVVREFGFVEIDPADAASGPDASGRPDGAQEEKENV